MIPSAPAARAALATGSRISLPPCGMTDIDKYREMTFLLQERYRRDIQGIPGPFLVSANPPFTEDDLSISAGDDVFRRKQQLLHRRRHTPLQKDRRTHRTRRLQQLKVLHIAGPDLDHIHILDGQFHIGGVRRSH